MRDIGVILLNFKTYKMTLNVVKNIKKQNYDGKIHIIVVDNMSSNESGKVLKSKSKSEGYTFIQSNQNKGYAAGNNMGLRYACSIGLKYSLIMNNDIEFADKNTIKKLVEVMDDNPTIGAISPIIIGGDGKKDPPIYYKKPNFWDLTFGILKFTKHRYIFNENATKKIYAPRGSFMLLNNKAIKKIDFLDENTFLYYEEPILAEKLAKIGYDCWHCSSTSVIHKHAVTIKKSINKNNTLKILCESYKYYLINYRKMNLFSTWCCILIRYIVAFRR